MSLTRHAVPKRIVSFGCLLGLSFALLGSLGSYLVGSLNKNYSEIVLRQLPSLGLVRDLSQANAKGRRTLESLPTHLDEQEWATVKAIVGKIRDENTTRLSSLENLLATPEGRRLIEELRSARQFYHEHADAFIEELREGVSKDRRAEWRATIDEWDSRYVEVQNQLASYCEDSATERGAELTSRSERLKWFFLVLAIWPLVMAAGFFFYGLVTTAVIFYRARRF